jgi:hypothetical protein
VTTTISSAQPHATSAHRHADPTTPAPVTPISLHTPRASAKRCAPARVENSGNQALAVKKPNACGNSISGDMSAPGYSALLYSRATARQSPSTRGLAYSGVG